MKNKKRSGWRRLLLLPALAAYGFAFTRLDYLPLPTGISLTCVGNWLMLILCASGMALILLPGARGSGKRAAGFILFLSPLWLIIKVQKGVVSGIDETRLWHMLCLFPLPLWGVVAVRGKRRALGIYLALGALLLVRMALPYLLPSGPFSAFSDIILMIAACLLGVLADAALYAPRVWAILPVPLSALAIALYGAGMPIPAWIALGAGIAPVAIQLFSSPARQNAWAQIFMNVSVLACAFAYLYAGMPA